MRILFSLAFATFSLSVSATPTELVLPSSYDNVGGGQIWGQVFTSEEATVAGAKFYIADPNRPALASVNALLDFAEIVLFDANKLEAPVEIGRSTIQEDGGTSSGLSTFYFPVPVATSVGRKYFIAIDAADQFGIGLQDLFVSTYAHGFEARLSGGQVLGEGSGRDLSFEILTSPVPEPAASLLLASGVLALLLMCRK